MKEDTKLAFFIRDELIDRGYEITMFNVNDGPYEADKLTFNIDENTNIFLSIDETDSLIAGKGYNKLEYHYYFKRVYDNFPAMSEVRVGDDLYIIRDINDKNLPTKVVWYRRSEHMDMIDRECVPNRDTARLLIDEVLLDLGLEDFIRRAW